MLAEFVKTIADFGKKQAVKKVIQDHRSGHQYILDVETGGVEWFDYPAPDRDHGALTIESLVRAVDLFANDGVGAVVWVSGSTIVGVLDDSEDKNNLISMQIAPSPFFRLLMQNTSPTPPADVYRRLSSEYEAAGMLFLPENLPDIMSDIKFETQKESQHKTGVADAAVAGSVKEKVSGAAKLPATVTCTFAPYPELDLPLADVDVVCSMKYDPSRGITMAPVPGAIAKAQHSAVEDIVANLSSKMHKHHVLAGTA
jgi:hypothetical protein